MTNSIVSSTITSIAATTITSLTISISIISNLLIRFCTWIHDAVAYRSWWFIIGTTSRQQIWKSIIKILLFLRAIFILTTLVSFRWTWRKSDILNLTSKYLRTMIIYVIITHGLGWIIIIHSSTLLILLLIQYVINLSTTTRLTPCFLSLIILDKLNILLLQWQQFFTLLIRFIHFSWITWILWILLLFILLSSFLFVSYFGIVLAIFSVRNIHREIFTTWSFE